MEFEEQAGHFWHIKYPLTDGSGYLEVATTRPETMLGDSGIAVNPNDERYKHLIGKTAILPLVGRELPIVGDEYVEMDFGTGVVKMTPAHDPNDFEVGLRHDLEVINVMNEDATINEKGGKYAGLDRYEARKQIVADLEEQGYIHQDRGLYPQCGQLLPLRHHHRADDLQAVVRQDEAAGRARHRGSPLRQDQLRPRTV